MTEPMSAVDADIVVETGVPVPMRDGVTLVADVYRPAAGRHPVLVHRTPYGRKQDLGSYIALNPIALARSGFSVVVQDTRARWDSGGQLFRPFDEAADGYDTVQWAAAQPWSAGRVGAYGSSYMAATQLQAATAAPPALVTICPAQASSDYYEGRSYLGGAFEYGALVTTSLVAMLPGSLVRADLSPEESRRLRSEAQTILDGLAEQPVKFPLRERLGGADGPLAKLTPWFFEWAAHTERDDYWRDLSLVGRHATMRTTALHISSWYDQFHPGTLGNYQAMRAHPDPAVADGQYLIVGPWHHFALPGYSLGTTRVGDCYFGTAAALNLAAIQQAWLESQLFDGGQFRQRARVRYFLMGADEWRSVDDWPPPGAVKRTLYLGADSKLGVDPASSTSCDSYDYDPAWPVPTHGGAHLALTSLVPAGPTFQDHIVKRPDVLEYSSPPLARELVLAGQVRVVLHVGSDAPTTDFTARLADTAPDGRVLGICDGIVRVRLDGGAGEAFVSMGSTAYRFAPTHRITLLISSSNFPRFDPNPNTGESALDCRQPRVARQQVRYGASHHSRLELSVLGVAPDFSEDS